MSSTPTNIAAANLQESSTDNARAVEAPVEVREVILVLTNVPDLNLGKRLAHVLLEEGLAACVNLGAPMLSMYRWQGTIAGDEEIPLFIKSTRDRQQALRDAIVRLHPYDVPEILVLSVDDGLPAYLQWVLAETRAPLHE